VIMSPGMEFEHNTMFVTDFAIRIW
jgi:hypothetical protein